MFTLASPFFVVFLCEGLAITIGKVV